MFSLLLYFLFFGGCFVVDNYFRDNKRNSKRMRNSFLFFLFIFLCFGYMTGSDWRSYELEYRDAGIRYAYSEYERGFFYLYYLMSKVFKDFFLTLGLLKCVYLWSLIKLLSKITDRWMAVLGVMFTTSLLFMLIDNPLRFMVANIFINFSILFYVEKKYVYFVLVGLCAPFFHTSTLFIFLIILLQATRIPFSKANKFLLFGLYVIVAFVFSEVSNAMMFKNYADISLLRLGLKTYESNYEVIDNEAFFTIGSALRIFLGALIIFNRELVLKVKNGAMIFDFTMIYLFLSRIVLIVPTGFRLAIPVGFFYAISLTIILLNIKHNVIRYSLMAVFSLILFRSLVNTFSYIPYSNSIYYILTEHKSYSERSMNNYIEYQNRTGKSIQGNK